ncbi:hypothetical protein FOZ63_003924, partial [Perkinsus olseni]
MVGSTRIESGAQPLAMLGPAHLAPETDAEVDTPSFIGQLVGTRRSPPEDPKFDFLSPNDSFLDQISQRYCCFSSPRTTRPPRIDNDTGADATVVPKKVFAMIWEALEWELGDDRSANRSELSHSIQLDEVDAFVDINGWIWFHTSVMDYLPVIAIDIDTESTLEMLLSQHVQVCKGEWCRLLVTDKLPFDKALDVFILGCPFFTEHD